MEDAGGAQTIKLKGYILGLTFTSIAGLILGWAAPLLELAGESGNVFSSILFYIAILFQLVGGILNFFALSYLRPAIVFPIYGSIQIFESVIVAQILLPATNPWSNLFYASLILIVMALLLIGYSISKKPEEEVVDLLPPNPQLECPNETVNEGFAEIFKLLDINLMGAYGRIKHRWAHSGGKYPHPTIIESCFSSLVWKLWMPEIALEILMPFFDAQAEDGRLPNKLKMFGKQYVIQPPLLAHCIATLNIPQKTLQVLYPKLKAYHQWYYQNRRNSDELFFWETPEESGMPEAPRFRNLKSISKIIPVDLNSLMVLQTSALAKIARRLGLPKETEKFESYSEELKKKVKETLWDSDSKMFYDWDSDKKDFIRILALTNFTPIIADIPDEEQLNTLISHLLDQNSFDTPIPFPSISILDETFSPNRWIGAVSVRLAYIILEGLIRYQKDEVVSTLALKLCQGIINEWKRNGSFNEFYSPNYAKIQLVGKPGEDYIGSTGLLNLILVEGVLGVRLTPNQLILHPRLPKEWQKKSISYKVPTKDIILQMTLEESNKVTGELVKGEEIIPFTLQNFTEKLLAIQLQA